jgi:hypothetical protein
MLWLSVAVVSVVVLHCSSWERSNPPLQIEISEAHRIQKFRGIASEILWRLCQDCPMSKDRSLIMNLRRAAAVHDSTAKQLLAKGCLLHRVSSMTSLHCPYIVLTMFESLESLERFVRRVLCGESARRLKGVAPGVGTVAARDLSRMNSRISEWISRHWRCRKYMNVSALERKRYSILFNPTYGSCCTSCISRSISHEHIAGSLVLPRSSKGFPYWYKQSMLASDVKGFWTLKVQRIVVLCTVTAISLE